MEGCVDLGVGYIQRWFTSHVVNTELDCTQLIPNIALLIFVPVTVFADPYSVLCSDIM